MKIVSIFSGVANQIKTLFSKSTISIDFETAKVGSLSFNQSLDNDIAALMRYKDAVLNGGASPTVAFETYMREASSTAKQYAESINAASIDISDFEVRAKQSYITVLSQSKSLSNAKTIINTFTKEGLEKAGLSAEQFTDSVSQGNMALGKYLVSVGQGNASLTGYVGSLIKAKVATIAMQAATMALNMALSMGISAAISFGMSLISDIIHREENLIAKSEEAADAIQSISDKFKTSSQTIDDIGKRFAELSQGVNQLTGANENLSNDEYAEFLDLSNQLAEIFPTLSRNYDENGNAIVDLSGDVDTICNSLNNLLETERQIANQSIVDNLPDLYSGIKTKSNGYVDEINDYKAQREELESYVKKFSDDNFENSFNEIIQGTVLSVNGAGKSLEELENITDSCLKILDEMGIKYEYLSSNYEYIDGVETPVSNNYNITSWSDGSLSEDEIQKQKDLIKSKIREIAATYQEEINNLNQQIAATENENKANWSGLLSSITSWLSTEDSYNSMSDDMQSIVQSMVNRVDFSTLNFDKWEDVESYISDDILAPIKNLTPEIQKSFIDLFSISTSDNSFTDYASEVENSIKQIAASSEFTEEQLKQLTGYKDALNGYNTAITNIKNSISDVTDEQIKALSPDKITKAYDYIKSYGLKTWDEIESALNNKTFEIVVDYKAEKEGMDNFLTAVEESVSATGMSSDAIANLKSRYQDLEGYDASRLFEKTTGGIHLNTKALNELEDEYVKTQKTLIDNKLDGLVEQYNSLTKEIENCTDAEQLRGLYTQRDNVLQQINDTSELASQYAGLTSAYNKWLQAQNSADERDGYENIGKGYDSIKELIEQGWVADSEVTEYLDLLLSADQRTKDNIADFDKLTKKISGTNFSIMDFFQYDEDNNLVSDGLFNFLDTVKAKLGDEFVKIGEDGAYSFDFAGDKINKVADALGMSVESVQLLEQAMIDAGFDVIFDSTFSDIDNIKKGAKDCVSVLKELKEQGKIDSDIADFNFKTTSIEDAKTQIQQAKDLLTEFTNKDGTVNLELEGAKEAASILATLIYRKNDLENPTLMNIEVDTSDAASDIEYAIGLLQQFKDANSNLEVQTAMGLDTTEAQGKVDSLLNEMSKNTIITSDLSIDTSSIDTAVSTINALKPQVMVDAGLDASKINGFVPENKTAKVTYEKDSTEVDKYNPPDFSRTVTFKKNSYEVDRYNPSNITRTVTYKIKTSGSAGAQGTAYAKGKWGTDNSGIALGGELGQELVVRNGRFFTIGDDSAEFFQYQKGDIIFNAEQTRQILANGKITNGAKRGVSYAEGTAFDSGSGGRRRTSGGSTHSAGSSSSSSKSSSSSSKSSTSSKSSSSKSSEEEKEPQIFDWIEIALSRIQRAIDNLSKKAESTFKKLSTRLSATNKEINKVNEEINLQQKAADRYMKEANNVGLSSALAKKVREGNIQISEYDEETQKLIDDYQKWYILCHSINKGGVFLFNCWESLKSYMPQRKVEINLIVMATKVEKNM